MLVKDGSFKLIPVSKPYCDVCKRNTFHLLKVCTEHDKPTQAQIDKVNSFIIPTGPDRDHTPIDQSTSSKLTSNQRSSKFNTTTESSHKWEFIDGQDDPLDQSLPRCVSCNEVIEVTTATYGKVAMKLYNKQIDFERTIAGSVFPARRYVRIPEYNKGYVCGSCYKDLWMDYYVNDKGEKVRSIIVLDHPENKVIDRFHKGRQSIARAVSVDRIKERDTRYDNLPRGRGEVKSVTTVILDHGIPTDEEWKAPSDRKPKALPIEVDAKSYAYFRRLR